MDEYTFPTRTNATSTATAGKDYLIYLNTGTTEAAPTWTLLGGQRSGDLNREADEIDASHKTSGGWKSTLLGLRSWSIDLETVYLAGDTGAKFLEASFLAGKQVHVKFEYPDKSFVTGWGSITECSLSTPHDDVATLKGTISGDGPLSEQSKG
jgi:TP901-1 family phage major tail protein